MAGDHEAPEAGQLPKAWTREVKRKEFPKSERRKDSVAGQCKIK